MPNYRCDNPDCAKLIRGAINPPLNCPKCVKEGRPNSTMSRLTQEKRKRAPSVTPAVVPAAAASTRNVRPRRGPAPVNLNLKVTFKKCSHAAAVNDENEDKYVGFKVTTLLTGPRRLLPLYEIFELKQYIKDEYKTYKRDATGTKWINDLVVKTPAFILDGFGETDSPGDQILDPDKTQFNDDPGWTTRDNLITKNNKFGFYKAELYWEVWYDGKRLHQTHTVTIEARADDNDNISYTFPPAPLTWKSPETY